MAGVDARLHSDDTAGAHDRRRHHPPRIRMINAVAILLAAALSLMALVALEHVFKTDETYEQCNIAYRECASAARDLQEASDYLTARARLFVVNGNREYMDAYMEELLVTDRRGRAVETLRSHKSDSEAAIISLEEALSHSNELAEQELYAMRLVTVARGIEGVPSLVAEVELSPEDSLLSADEQLALAEQMVLGREYDDSKRQITAAVDTCSSLLLEQLNEDIDTATSAMHMRLERLQLIVIALLGIVVLVIFAVIFLILWPLAAYTKQIKEGESLVLAGASELRYLADAYNVIYAENHERTAHLQHAAERDHLTGLYNRGAYDQLLAENATDMALLLVDVDYFKDVNDSYGHDMGDAVLRKVAGLLEHSFRATDFACRIGGDEFAVIATKMDPSLSHVISSKISQVKAALLDTSDGLPAVTLSVGVAFSEAHPGEDDIYKAADRALYTVKERGRNGCAFYDQVVAAEQRVIA